MLRFAQQALQRGRYSKYCQTATKIRIELFELQIIAAAGQRELFLQP